MKRQSPTRVVETGRVVRGSSGQGLGWLEELGVRFNDLRARVMGVEARLRSPLRHGVPGAVVGEQTFLADLNTTVSIANFPSDPEAGTFINPLTVNPIIKAGQTYRIPVTFRPPGVFEAKNLVVGIEAGFTSFAGFPRTGITPLADYRQRSSTDNGLFIAQPDIGELRYTFQQQVLGNFASVLPFLPFFWNIVDEKSGRQYAQDWMPHGALLNSRAPADDSTVAGAVTPDGDLFEFDAPWLFERDGQVAFLFRPVMDLYQVAVGDATLPYGVSDASAGRRQQQATVRVEFHGVRHYDNQDMLKQGAQL